jgi:hypothetical protein
MFDVENNPVVGDNQMKANIKIRKLLGEGIKLEQASAKDQAIISKWLADAKRRILNALPPPPSEQARKLPLLQKRRRVRRKRQPMVMTRLWKNLSS